MITPIRTAVAAASVFAGLLAPAAMAAAEPLALAPVQQSGESVAGPGSTGSFDPSPTGSANLIKAFQTGSGQCNKLPIPSFDGSAAPWCG
ncbi:MAG: hypothetical protein JWN03_5532 [Nocardia sp.]|uniref:hypothetical protein n=1 Tax=Nocardia sp. TaxID=1821 RepID=UPI00260C5032|nr:hypothetical protein [Nocardia sp.]MCU1645257.1 hypothetical protein [Nocardia sp.]